MASIVSIAFGLAALVHTAPSHAQDDEETVPAPPDTGVPGPLVAYATPPALARETKACSMRLPLCVHAAGTTPGRAVLDVLTAGERAWDTLAGALRLHPPDGDLEDLAYHVYLVEGAGEPGLTLATARDVRSTIDRARSLTVLDAKLALRAGCALDALVAREMARAFMMRAAPATAEGVARGQATYLAQVIVPCAVALVVEGAQAFQSAPGRAICDAGDPGTSTATMHDSFLDGSALWWQRIDWAYGRGPGAIITASWALAPTHTAVPAQRWHDEPDAFDVLRVSFKGALSTGSTLDDLLLDTAIARAFMGSADDGLHAPETRTLGDAARITSDWDLPWPKQPKRLAPRAPVHPGGASYLVVHRAGAPATARLRVEIVWEEHALFRWAFVKVDASGREIGRVVIPTRERATETQMTLVDLGTADRILLVGVNAGDPAYRFDPDDEVWEPHSWLVTIAEEN